MLLKFKRLPQCPGLPVYATAGAAGMDLRACLREDLFLGAGQRALIATGLQVEIPKGHALMILPRSGIAANNGITVLNAPGLIDSDYRGELKVLLVNHGYDTFIITHGDRIAQAVLAPVIRAQIMEADELTETARGDAGFGSTGV